MKRIRKRIATALFVVVILAFAGCQNAAEQQAYCDSDPICQP